MIISRDRERDSTDLKRKESKGTRKENQSSLDGWFLRKRDDCVYKKEMDREKWGKRGKRDKAMDFSEGFADRGK